MLNADRLQIQQTLFNLVDNAIDALLQVAPERRRLSIRTVREARDAQNGGDSLLIEVRDHGPGLHDADRMFQPFFTTKQDGMGMGLAICQSIVDAHGGRLWASNHAGTGATLHIRLPFSHALSDMTLLAPIAPIGPLTIPVGQIYGSAR